MEFINLFLTAVGLFFIWKQLKQNLEITRMNNSVQMIKDFKEIINDTLSLPKIATEKVEWYTEFLNEIENSNIFVENSSDYNKILNDERVKDLFNTLKAPSYLIEPILIANKRLHSTNDKELEIVNKILEFIETEKQNVKDNKLSSNDWDEIIAHNYTQYFFDKFLILRTQVLNELESISMQIITGSVNEEAVFPIIHQLFLATVKLFSPQIIFANRRNKQGVKYYYYTIDLFTRWNLKMSKKPSLKIIYKYKK